MKESEKERLYELEKKNPAAAAWLSIIPGLGHVYAGKAGQGVAFFLMSALLWLILLGWIPWLIGFFDAHQTAKKANEAARIRLGLSR